MSKSTLITEYAGQDGAQLAGFLLARCYSAHSIKHRAPSCNTALVDHLYQDPHERNVCLRLHYGDLTGPRKQMPLAARAVLTQVQ
jgi:GDPmannose 4,6-dehydratase